MEIKQNEIQLKIWLSLMNKYGYKDTVKQLECLVTLWKTTYTKIYTTGSKERLQFIKSFNIVKAVTMRNEFLKTNKLPYCEGIFDCIDNLFSRLTDTDKSQAYSLLFQDITNKTEMFKNMTTTINKLESLKGLVSENPSVTEFYIECFMFLLAMEGMYDEVVRFVYATELIIDNKKISPEILKNTNIEEIKSRIKTQPRIIFDVWDSGHRVRNAVAHARFYYNKEDNKMKFVDVNLRDPTDIYTTFLEIKEIEDLVNKIRVICIVFIHLLGLLHVFSLLVIAPKKGSSFLWTITDAPE